MSSQQVLCHVGLSMKTTVLSRERELLYLYLERRKKCCYMVVITCLVFLIVSRDWSAYTLTLESIKGYNECLYRV